MKLSLTQIRRAVIILTLLLLSAVGGYWFGTHRVELISEKGRKPNFKIINEAVPQEEKLDFSLFWRVWGDLKEKYLEKDKLDPQKMFYGAIEGMTSSLGDPYTVFLPPQENKKLAEDLNGSFQGIGIRLGFDKQKRLTVIAPLKGMPAEAAGIRAGDVILHLRDAAKGIDEDTLGMSLPQAVEKIRGREGTKITLTLLHEREENPFEAEISRAQIIVPSVEVEFLKQNKGEIAHLKLMRFGDLTSQQWNEEVLKIKNKGNLIRGIVLDLRGNPGGYLSGAVNLASEFLAKGVIVQQENYQGEIETYSVNKKGRLLEVPLVVLIDKGSASASEILAAALADNQRAVLVGETSFGKGTIQEAEDLGNGSSLHITTAKWLTPNKIWVNGKGIKPDIEVKNDAQKPKEDKQLEKAIEVLLKT